MLQIINSRTGYFLPSFLALLYLTLGAYVLHPHFHNDNNIQHDHQSKLVVTEVHDHDDAVGTSSGDEHYSCPICDFLAVCSALDLGNLLFLIPSYPGQRIDTEYQQSDILSHQLAIQIRGPPRTFFS